MDWWTREGLVRRVGGGREGGKGRDILRGASRESSSVFQYFFICASVTLDALIWTSPSRPSLFRFVFRFGAVDVSLAGESRMITSATSVAVWLLVSGSGVEIAAGIASSRGCESFDFLPGCGLVAFVTLEALLLKERVDCWEDWEDAAVGAGALRRVAGIIAVG